MDRLLDRNAGQIEQASERWHTATLEYQQAGRIERDWLTDHGPDAERLLRVDGELKQRDQVDRHAQR